MAEINWNLLTVPNPLAYAVDGYQAGRQAAAARDKAALLKRSEDREEAQYQAGLEKEKRRKAIVGKYATDPNAARAEAAGEGLNDQLKAWTDEEKHNLEAAGLKVDGTASAAQWLLKDFKGATPQQRKAAALQNAPSFAKYGITAEDIAAIPDDNYTDEALNGTIQTAMGWKASVEQANKDRDALLARDKLTEDQRHNQAVEATGATNAAANTIRAKKPTGGRAKSGGTSIPAPPQGWSKAGG